MATGAYPYQMSRSDRVFYEDDGKNVHCLSDSLWVVIKGIIWAGLHFSIGGLAASQIKLQSTSVSSNTLNAVLILAIIGAGVNVLAAILGFFMRNKKHFLASYEFIQQLMYFTIYVFVSYALWNVHSYVGSEEGKVISNDSWFIVNTVLTVGITCSAFANGFDQMTRAAYTMMNPDFPTEFKKSFSS